MEGERLLPPRPGEGDARIDSRQAWLRLASALALMTIGSAPMYVISVVLPVVQTEFGVARADASLPYTLLLVGFGLGGVLMGRLAERFGIQRCILLGAGGLALGFVAAGASPTLLTFALAHGIGLGLLGSSATFAPLVADTSLWFARRRGIAVAVCASGNYVAGAFWPPVVQHFIETAGWRSTYTGLGVLCAVAMPLLAMGMRARSPAIDADRSATSNADAVSPAASVAHPGVTGQAPEPSRGGTAAPDRSRPMGFSVTAATVLLCIAGVACCVAMAMPQVHIVAYCGELGFGAARGAQMLSLMLACGIVSRLVSGAICDRIGGLRTLLLGSVLQGVALLLFLPFDSLVSLYAVSALFGLFQGGIVPAYAIIVREHFPAKGMGARVGLVLMCTLFGMALGGWLSGKVFDLTGTYEAAFLNGVAWNTLNVSITLVLLAGASGWWRRQTFGSLATPTRPR